DAAVAGVGGAARVEDLRLDAIEGRRSGGRARRAATSAAATGAADEGEEGGGELWPWPVSRPDAVHVVISEQSSGHRVVAYESSKSRAICVEQLTPLIPRVRFSLPCVSLRWPPDSGQQSFRDVCRTPAKSLRGAPAHDRRPMRG